MLAVLHAHWVLVTCAQLYMWLGQYIGLWYSWPCSLLMVWPIGHIIVSSVGVNQ